MRRFIFDSPCSVLILWRSASSPVSTTGGENPRSLMFAGFATVASGRGEIVCDSSSTHGDDLQDYPVNTSIWRGSKRSFPSGSRTIMSPICWI